MSYIASNRQRKKNNRFSQIIFFPKHFCQRSRLGTAARAMLIRCFKHHHQIRFPVWYILHKESQMRLKYCFLPNDIKVWYEPLCRFLPNDMKARYKPLCWFLPNHIMKAWYKPMCRCLLNDMKSWYKPLCRFLPSDRKAWYKPMCRILPLDLKVWYKPLCRFLPNDMKA